MKHVIIGTAGHVDHGKTLLVKALTGIETDRLVEEKKRGITIELGFAHIDWEDGTQAGIVDVPGHEKFIKNMLAGAGGIDLAMLVVAADEGFMPQTVEHLEILSLLGIRDGLVVITKKDAVDQEWLEMVEEDIKERVKGTFLENKAILSVSAYTNEGIPQLREALYQLVCKSEEKNVRIPFRLPIDRFFSVDGFGTVVTGTLIEGCMNEGAAVELVPSGVEARIRSLQVHNKSVKQAFAGQRVAVNLTGLKRTDIQRGDAVVRPGTVQASHMLDVKLQVLKDSRRMIKNGMQVHLYHGTLVALAKVILLDCDGLNPGESGFAQLRTKEPIASKSGDRFVIRFYSPLETIGGGVILDDQPERHKRHDAEVLKTLEIKESGSSSDRLEQAIQSYRTALPTCEVLAVKLGAPTEELNRAVQELIGRGKVIEPLPGRYVAAAIIDDLWKDCRELLNAYHRKNPLHAGMKAAELRQKLFRAANQDTADALLQELCREGKIRHTLNHYALADFEIHFTKRQNTIRESVKQIYLEGGLEPPTIEEVQKRFPVNQREDLKQVMDSMISGGELVLLTSQLCCGAKAFQKICQVMRACFAHQETVTLAEIRDALQTSRKYALVFLEYFDRNHITKKEGDCRRLLRGFEEIE